MKLEPGEEMLVRLESVPKQSHSDGSRGYAIILRVGGKILLRANDIMGNLVYNVQLQIRIGYWTALAQS